MKTVASPRGVGKAELGIAGALIVAAELIASGVSNQQLSDKIDRLQHTVVEMRVEREQFFVRKSVIIRIQEKLEELALKLHRLGGDS